MENATFEKPSDSDEFVIRSGVRSGLKREFAFALRVQSEMFGSLGRTRTRKASQIAPSANEVSLNSTNKRSKTSQTEKIPVESVVGNPEPSDASTTTTALSTGGSVEDETRSADAMSPLRSDGPKKKLELKMSKKIVLTKFPSNVRELLATGLLEGLPVKYLLRRSKKQEELRGVIKDSGILCSCSSCKGCKVVTVFHFQQHAGYPTKYAPGHIYLENGNTIRDILNACNNAPLDMLEATIQRLSKPALIPESSGSNSKSLSRQKSSGHRKITRKDLRLHKLVFMEDVLPDGTEVAYYASGKRLLEGYKKGNGIFCSCCNSEVSPSQFEAHAGWASRRKPYLHIYTSNGVSLHELSVSLSKGQKFSVSDNDDLCTICADGGDLLLCDGCPRAFHTECIDLPSVPNGDWYCSYCQNLFEKEKLAERNADALAAGRVSGVDPIEQITNRCIRIVKTQEIESGGCVLCREHDFSKSGFGPRTVLLCDQCEKEYHVGCLKDHKMGDLQELPKGKWFCCADCNRIHAALQKLLHRESEKLPDSLSDVIKCKYKNKDSINDSDLDVKWRLLSGNVSTSDSRLLLSKAVAIFHNCFDSIVDSTTDRDLIPSMVYGRNIRDREFRGMYCAVLTVNSSVVSAAIFRIFGQEVAELPLVATKSEKQGQGYFQSLFSCIEALMGSMGVRNLVLPAAAEAESIWTKKFGFKKITRDELCKYAKDSKMMVFEGTSMLQKSIPKS